MRFNAQIQLMRFDIRGYAAELDRFLTDEIKDIAKSWLRTVLVIIPTWSRASRATFNALAEDVGFALTFGPIRAPKDRLTLGLRTSSGGIEIKKLISYQFFYQTDLRYLEFNEFNRADFGSHPSIFSRAGIPNTPYRFLEAGEADARSRLEVVILPSPADFIIVRKA